MKKEFQMSMLGEPTFFLGLQVYQIDKGIFISQTKYIKDMVKIFKMEYSKCVSTPMITYQISYNKVQKSKLVVPVIFSTLS